LFRERPRLDPDGLHQRLPSAAHLLASTLLFSQVDLIAGQIKRQVAELLVFGIRVDIVVEDSKGVPAAEMTYSFDPATRRMSMGSLPE
jgi:hypothetical protein